MARGSTVARGDLRDEFGVDSLGVAVGTTLMSRPPQRKRTTVQVRQFIRNAQKITVTQVFAMVQESMMVWISKAIPLLTSSSQGAKGAFVRFLLFYYNIILMAE